MASDADANRFAERTCAVCLGDFKNPSETGKCLPCGHWFCDACVPLITGPDKTCPECRKPIQLPGLAPPPAAPPLAPPEPAIPLEIVLLARDAVQEAMSYMSGSRGYIKPGRCRMWRPAEPASYPTKCTNPVKHVVTRKHDPVNRHFLCNMHCKPTDIPAGETLFPLSSRICDDFTKGRKALPLRQCARLADNRETGLCDSHCEQVLGVRRVPFSYRKNALDETRIKAFIESVRGSSSSSSSSSSAVNNLK